MYQTRGQNDDELALTDLSEIAKLSNLMKRAHEAASLAMASAPEMVTTSTQTDNGKRHFIMKSTIC